MGGRDAWARRTMSMIWASALSAPTLVERIRSDPVPFTVARQFAPAVTVSAVMTAALYLW